MYSSRGPVCDIHNKEVLEQLTNGLKELAKKYNAFVLKIEPDIKSDDQEFRKIVTELKYKIKDDAKNFSEEIQPRYVFRLDIKGKTEDELLAKEVPEIDLIISGHSHTTLEEPIEVKDNFLVSAGSYGQNLGKIILQNNNGSWDVKEYQLIPIDNSFESDPEIAEIVNVYKKNIDEEYLSLYDLQYDQEIGRAHV